MKTLWEKIRKTFAISKRLLFILVFGNVGFFFYHFLWIGMDFKTAGILQITAFLTELVISRWYEKLLSQSNRKANEWTRKRQTKIMQTTIKGGLFILCLLVTYTMLYCIRLEIFANIFHYGVTPEKLEKGIRNALIWSPALGIVMGFSTIKKIKERKKNERKKIH